MEFAPIFLRTFQTDEDMKTRTSTTSAQHQMKSNDSPAPMGDDDPTSTSSAAESPKKRGRKKKLPSERCVVPFSRTWERAKTIYDFYLQHGTKMSAQHFNMSYGYIQVLVHKYRKFSNDTRSRVRGVRLPKEEKKKIYDYYSIHGYDETAKHFGYSKLFIYNLVRYYKSKLKDDDD